MKIAPAPAGPVEFPEFRVEAPPGTDWEFVRTSDEVLFRNQLGAPTHTLVALAARHKDVDPARAGFADYATSPAVFAEYVRANADQSARAGTRDMAVLERNVRPDNRFGYCVAGHEKAEDYDSEFAPRVLILETWSYTCLAPGDPRVIVEVAFSERAPQGEADAAIAATREAYFNGFRFRTAGASPAVAVPAEPATSATAAGRVRDARSAPDSQGSSATPATAGSVVFLVKTTLREAVDQAVAANAASLDYGFEAASPPAAAITVELEFKSVVDRSSQLRNQGGAIATGPLGLLVGAITPWACPVEHTLAARVSDVQGQKLGFYQLRESEKRVGTMLVCGDVEEPSRSIAVKLLGQLLRAMAADRILP